MNERVLLEVGDKVQIENWFSGKKIVTITRVTKTKAVAHVVSADKSTYDYNFDRVVIGNVVTPKPRITWDTTKRTLIK